MNRKIRTHTAHGQRSTKRTDKNATITRHSLPERPQTSLGFDRELSHVTEAFQAGHGITKKKKKILSDRPDDSRAFKSSTVTISPKHEQRVPPLKDVLAKFAKYEEDWERRRASSANYHRRRPHSSQPGKIDNETVDVNKQSLSIQTKLTNVPQGTCKTTDEIKTKQQLVSQSGRTRRRSNYERNSTDKFGQILKKKVQENTQQLENPFTVIPSETTKVLRSLSKKPQHSLPTLIDAEDIERYIEDDESSPVVKQLPSGTVNQVSNTEHRRQETEEDYDTELEDDFPASAIEEYDPTGRRVYVKSCKNQDVIPVTYIYKRLGMKELIMRHHGLGSYGTKPLVNALMKNTCVEVLDLTDNDIQSDGSFFISLMLYENFYITDLDLSENSLRADGGISLAKVLLSNTSLKRLILRGNHLTDRAAKVFAEVFKENRTLLELDLSYNDIGESGGLFLGAGLGLNYGLRTLDLSWNGIRNKGAVSMAASMKTNDSLRRLNLAWNGLAFIGALAFMRHLKKNDTLKELDISNNRINPKGAVRLSSAIAINTSLEILKIGQNPIGDEGVEAILNAAKKNLSVKFLGLEDITVSPKVHEEIIQLQEIRDIVIMTGGRTGHTAEMPPPTGMEILIQFIQDNRLRLKDLFFQFDKDQSGDISRDEFKTGLKETGITMSEKQLDALIESIDIDNSNTIEYSEILYGREAVMKERRFQRKVAIRTEQREKESIMLPTLKGFED